jgi:tetratricopeptide (TPR) repeat protein
MQVRAMCEEYLLGKLKGFNEFAIIAAPFVLIIGTICLMYVFRDTLAGNVNSVSLIVTLFSFSFGALLAVNQYSLKAKAEKVEHEVRLITLFSEVMGIAHARGEPFVVNNEIKTAPVGLAAQNAAIAAIDVLGEKYEDILGEAANQGLETLTSFKSEVVGKYRDNEKIFETALDNFDKNIIIKKRKYYLMWMKKGEELYNQGKYLDSSEAYEKAAEFYKHPDASLGRQKAFEALNPKEETKKTLSNPGSQP